MNGAPEVRFMVLESAGIIIKKQEEIYAVYFELYTDAAV